MNSSTTRSRAGITLDSGPTNPDGAYSCHASFVVKNAATPLAFPSRHSTAAVCHAFMKPWSTSVVSTGTQVESSLTMRSSGFANRREQSRVRCRD